MKFKRKLGILALSCGALLNLAACKKTGEDKADVGLQGENKTMNELIKEDKIVGTGAEATPGKNVEVHYTGWLVSDGTKFDSSKDRNQTFVFELGKGMVIRGWDEGVKGMKVGGKRILTIPPEMGYGAAGAGGVIPPGASLKFEVDLIGVK